MSQRYFERIGFDGDSDLLITDIAQAFGLGRVERSAVLEVGYEDCNVRMDTDAGKFVVKAFADFRNKEQTVRYVDVMKSAIAGGVTTPALYSAQGKELFTHPSGVSLVVMDFVEGNTYFDSKATPTDAELDLVMSEAVKIHSLNIRPPMLFDSWAIPNIHKMADLVDEHLDEEGRALAKEAINRYDSIDSDHLTSSFVHGDITSTNTLKGVDGKMWILDFAVANVYPKIQELAVIASNLLAVREGIISLKDRVVRVTDSYKRQGGILNEYEEQAIFEYSLAGVAMEFLGGHKAKFIDKENPEESEHWLELGRNGLREALS